MLPPEQEQCTLRAEKLKANLTVIGVISLLSYAFWLWSQWAKAVQW